MSPAPSAVVTFLEDECKSFPENFERAYWDVTFTFGSAIISLDALDLGGLLRTGPGHLQRVVARGR